MGKACSLRECRVGKEKERIKRFQNNLRQLSVFRVPKNTSLKAKWEQSLGQKLNANQFVCEKHFREADIKKADRFIINGVETFLSRERWSLVNEHVVPINRHGSKTDMPEGEDPLGVDEIEKSHNSNTSSQNVEEINIKEDLNFSEVYLVEYSSEDAAENNDLPSPSSTTANSAVTVEEIQAHFSSTLMQGWCFFANDEELIFSHINILTRKEDMHFSVANDLSVKVSLNERPEYSTNDRIACVDDVKKYMEKLQATILCEGTGIPNNKFSSKCTGQVLGDDCELRLQNQRCSWCRSLRKRIQQGECNDTNPFKVQISQGLTRRSRK